MQVQEFKLMLLLWYSHISLIAPSANGKKKRKLTIMKLSELLGWIIGAIDMVFLAYAIFDFTPFILMVGISLIYIVIMIVKNRKLTARA